jgi:phage virion morphogenesis protein
MIDLQIGISGIKEFTYKLYTLEGRLQNMDSLMVMISQLMLKSVRQNFFEGGRPTKWSPLSGKSIKGGLRGVGGRSYLFLQGKLFASIQPYHSSNEARVATEGIEYSAIHQWGGLAGKNSMVKIPPRPYMLFQNTDINEIVQKVQEYLRLSDLGTNTLWS